MKKIMILLTFVSLTVIQASESKVEQVLEGYMNAWAEHNITKIESYYHTDVIWYDLPSDSTNKGKEKVGKAITDAFLGYVPDMFWVKNGDVFVSGNSITYEWIYGGTFNGSWGDVKVKNKKFSIKGISTTTIDNEGKIIAQKDYYDLYGFQKQLGVIK
jgi:ketosteroid isomerase-like protein